MPCEYEKFLTEVFYLKGLSEAPTKQHEIYFNEIRKFLKSASILTPTQVVGCLSRNSKVTQSDLNLMEKELKLFSVTYLSGESNIGYPAFQFDLQAGIAKPVISSILKPLNRKYENWDLVFWFNSFFYDLGGSIIEVLDSASLESLLLEVKKEYS